MKFVINGDYLTKDKIGGVTRYATEVLDELDKLVKPGDVELLAPSYAVQSPKYQNIKLVKYGSQTINKWRYMTLPSYVRKNHACLIDIDQTFPPGVSGIEFFHDCIPEIIPETFQGAKGKYIVKPIKLLQRKITAKASRVVITVSRTSKNDIVKYLGVSPKKVVVAYNAWQHMNKIAANENVLEKFSLTDHSFYFSLGSRVPHKNLKWIVEVAKRNPDSIFVVTGDNSYMKGFDEQAFPDNIIFTGYLDDPDIKGLYAHCKAFILPSFYEGFGIPPLEAASQGAPIIVAKASCLPEIYGNSAHYFDPNDYEVDLDELLKEPVDSTDQILEKYQWKKSAMVLYKVMQKISK